MTYLLFESQYLLWIWSVLTLASVLVVLAGWIGVDMIRDWLFYWRLEKGNRPKLRRN